MLLRKVFAGITLPDVLYHYCVPSTFDAILASKTLRLSDSRFMNDYLERAWINTIIEAAIERRIATSAAKFVEPEQSGHMYSDYKILYDVQIFIGCFSEGGDLLSQWRAYAGDGTGYAIGFGVGDLRHMMRLDWGCIWMEETSAGICRVVYDEAEQEAAVDSIFEVWNEHYRRLPPGDLAESVVDQGAYCLANLSRICKNPCFREEREWRLIYVPRYDHENPPLTVHGISRKVHYRRSGSNDVPYLEWQFAHKRVRSPIAEVVLGPKNTTPIAEVQDLLDRSGFGAVTVRRSKASYR